MSPISSKFAAPVFTRPTTASLKHKQLEMKKQTELGQLQSRDGEVRTHGQTHETAGGSAAGVTNYQYQHGPDGRAYAVNDETPANSTPAKDNPKTSADKAYSKNQPSTGHLLDVPA